jgi:hypothetical protein
MPGATSLLTAIPISQLIDRPFGVYFSQQLEHKDFSMLSLKEKVEVRWVRAKWQTSKPNTAALSQVLVSPIGPLLPERPAV